MELSKLYFSRRTGKVSDKWFSYFDIYESAFQNLKNRNVNIVEVGVQNGGSLEVWSQYFQNAQNIIGCDINPKCGKLIFEDKKIKVIVGDVNNADVVSNIFDIINSVDVFIDDGSHMSSDIINTFVNFFPKLSSGGVYIIEDLHCSYWPNYEGGVLNSKSSISFLKKLVDICNHQYWTSNSYKKEFFTDYGINLNELEKQFAKIKSIQFFDSMCVISKKLNDKFSLGSRVVVGDLEPVCSVLQFNGSNIDPSNLCVSSDSNEPCIIDSSKLVRNDDVKPNLELEKLRIENYELKKMVGICNTKIGFLSSILKSKLHE